jgi:hypothetical protein
MRGNYAALTVPKASGEPPLTNPITGIVGRRARALNGHAAAPPPSSEELAPFLLMEMHLLPLASKEQHNGFASIESGALLQCRIFIRPRSALGHFRQINPPPTPSGCPFRSDRVRTFAPQRFDAVCHVWTAPALQEGI